LCRTSSSTGQSATRSIARYQFARAWVNAVKSSKVTVTKGFQPAAAARRGEPSSWQPGAGLNPALNSTRMGRKID
jgi:hypothetical protein